MYSRYLYLQSRQGYHRQTNTYRVVVVNLDVHFQFHVKGRARDLSTVDFLSLCRAFVFGALSTHEGGKREREEELTGWVVFVTGQRGI